ncbi:hypothetical protein HMPREF0381_0001 [Lachnoanaerobaculum saburreum DSM 3986]|uniref:Uncharacterized protein n=1 Tax=Lachnoanaerobaculum saburreum DSM 3986 TaxID=887325 RepID=E6LJ66_9FIRM|nr:hypothetical protein HMPREF0381_0001 [Lachnoanaerobaculum saburreum DSM 3986]
MLFQNSLCIISSSFYLVNNFLSYFQKFSLSLFALLEQLLYNTKFLNLCQ